MRAKIGVGAVHVSQKAQENVMNVLTTHRLSYGPYSKQFERRFADAHNRAFAVFVNSGTDALRVGLAAMKEKFGWENGDEVLVPATTFVASVNTIMQVGLKPLLVDIEPNYYGINWEQVGAIIGRYEAAQYKQPVAVMPVHLFGQAVPPPNMLKTFGIRVIADSCETMFVPGCAEGDVSCFSTYACHVLCTGIGGLATTNDPRLAELMRSYANHGRSGVYASIDEELGRREIIDERFKFERLGFSARATEMEAAIGCAEMDDWERNLQARRKNAAWMSRLLCDLPLVLPKIRPGSEHSWMMYPLRTMDKTTCDRLVSFIEANGIETRRLLPLTDQPYMKALYGDDLESRYPVSKMVNETGFYIGCHAQMTTDDLVHIDEVFHSFKF